MISIVNNLPTEKVTLLKNDGRVFEGIVAHVQPDIIFTEDMSAPIEEDDYILRKLPNGLEERYLIIDRGFYDAFHGLPSHYQIKVRKQNKQDRIKSIPQTIIVNNNGEYSKANLNSTDNSVNNYNSSTEIFNELKKLALEIPQEDRTTIINSIDDMQENNGKKNFVEKYNLFIQNAANYMTIFAPLIPTLTNLLTK